MDLYRNLHGHSGVIAYSIGEDFIDVVFAGEEATYRYTYESTGRDSVEAMKTHAREGRGLSTYISQNVRERYAKKFIGRMEH